MPYDLPDSYLTLTGCFIHEIKIKGSRFIAIGNPAGSESRARQILESIKKTEFGANHHCYAYTTGLDKIDYKYSDDGEPSGTAGRPIYQVISGRSLKNILVVVVRYFGGTKLGTGGLTRAYSQATTEMLEGAVVTEKLICDRLGFSIPFNLYDRLMKNISDGNYKIISREYSERVDMVLEIRKSHVDGFIERLTELTGGRVEIQKLD